LNRVEPPTACYRVAGLADTNALPERSAGKRGKRKIADHPAISHVVIEHDAIAIVFVVAAGITRAQSGEE